jgi:hypothetical protein
MPDDPTELEYVSLTRRRGAAAPGAGKAGGES